MFTTLDNLLASEAVLNCAAVDVPFPNSDARFNQLARFVRHRLRQQPSELDGSYVLARKVYSESTEQYIASYWLVERKLAPEGPAGDLWRVADILHFHCRRFEDEPTSTFVLPSKIVRQRTRRSLNPRFRPEPAIAFRSLAHVRQHYNVQPRRRRGEPRTIRRPTFV